MIKDIKLYNDNIKKVLKNNKFLELKDKKILITGANGLIGSAIIDLLNYLNCNEKYNIKIIAMVRDKQKALSRIKQYENCEIIEQDITNEIKYDENIDYIIHAASNAHPQAYANDPVGTMLGNFIGVNNILKFAIKHKCKKVEYISSGEVYGEGSEEIESFDENYVGRVKSMDIRSCYPLSKLSAETLCISYSEQYNIQTVIARPCHIYGPTQTEKDSRVSAQFIRNALKKEDIIMKSAGKQLRSYCYVLDCVTGILTILTKGENTNAYNIANKESIITIKQMAQIIAKKSSTKVIFKTPTKKESKGYNKVTKSILNEDKLKKLGWHPCYNFTEGIEQCLEIMK